MIGKRPINDKASPRPPSGKKPTTSPRVFTFDQKPHAQASPKGSPAGSPRASSKVKTDLSKSLKYSPRTASQ